MSYLARGLTAIALLWGVILVEMILGALTLRVLPAHYGLACGTDYACYGCIVPVHPAKLAVVIDC